MSEPARPAAASPGADSALRARIWEIHWAVRTFVPFVARVALALYDPQSARLIAYVHSSDDEGAPRAPVPLEDAPSLRGLLDEGHPLVVRCPLTFEDADHEPSNRLGRSGYAASYTLPLFADGAFLGFVFFNSREPGVFSAPAIAQLGIFGHLASLLVVRELAAIRSLAATLDGARLLAFAREAGTGSHLDRLSRYAGLAARALAGRHAALDEEFIERIECYAPLHDIGKNGIPDAILLKAGPLDPDEREVVRTHPNRGHAILEDLITHFGLEALADTDLALAIVLHHHERVDGTGYPHGLAGEAIPLEARIVAAADVLDALTSARPYREALSNDDAFALLERMAGTQLDEECVRALVDARGEVERIQARYPEDAVG